ncbi:MAG: hypothetical protein OEZ59_06445 [Deltaproteobacteria bacterium]|nr:hypothetical protein [Deltaproteobacteria bacterium]
MNMLKRIREYPARNYLTWTGVITPVLFLFFAVWYVVFHSDTLEITQPRQKESPEETYEDFLRNLADIRGVEVAEYSAAGLYWKMNSPQGRVEYQRFAFGYFKLNKIIKFISPRASIVTGTGQLEILASRVSFQPWNNEWVFSQGMISTQGRSRRFGKLSWLPKNGQLNIEDKKNRLAPLLDFWKPKY